MTKEEDKKDDILKLLQIACSCITIRKYFTNFDVRELFSRAS